MNLSTGSQRIADTWQDSSNRFKECALNTFPDSLVVPAPRPKGKDKSLWLEVREPLETVRLIALELPLTIEPLRLRVRIWFYSNADEQYESLRISRHLSIAGQTILHSERVPRPSWGAYLNTEGIEVRGLEYPVDVVLGLEDFHSMDKLVAVILQDVRYSLQQSNTIRSGASDQNIADGSTTTSVQESPLCDVETTNKIDLFSLALEAEGIFDPHSLEDDRSRALRSIALRRGQHTFRDALLDAYDSRCAITNCGVSAALEAAHIVPYKGERTNTVTNGLLLRADIHTLFDLGLIAIDSSTMTIIMAEVLQESEYADLHKQSLRLPTCIINRPDPLALDWHKCEVFGAHSAR